MSAWLYTIGGPPSPEVTEVIRFWLGAPIGLHSPTRVFFGPNPNSRTAMRVEAKHVTEGPESVARVAGAEVPPHMATLPASKWHEEVRVWGDARGCLQK